MSPDLSGDPFIRETGRLADDAGREVVLGVCYGAVTLRTSGAAEFPPAKAEEFAQLYLAACWAAARDGAALVADAEITGAGAGS